MIIRIHILVVINLLILNVVGVQLSRKIDKLGQGFAADQSCVVLTEGLGVKCFGTNSDGK
jgi:hypothetical protein